MDGINTTKTRIFSVNFNSPYMNDPHWPRHEYTVRAESPWGAVVALASSVQLHNYRKVIVKVSELDWTGAGVLTTTAKGLSWSGTIEGARRICTP